MRPRARHAHARQFSAGPRSAPATPPRRGAPRHHRDPKSNRCRVSPTPPATGRQRLRAPSPNSDLRPHRPQCRRGLRLLDARRGLQARGLQHRHLAGGQRLGPTEAAAREPRLGTANIKFWARTCSCPFSRPVRSRQQRPARRRSRAAAQPAPARNRGCGRSASRLWEKLSEGLPLSRAMQSPAVFDARHRQPHRRRRGHRQPARGARPAHPALHTSSRRCAGSPHRRLRLPGLHLHSSRSASSCSSSFSCCPGCRRCSTPSAASCPWATRLLVNLSHFPPLRPVHAHRRRVLGSSRSGAGATPRPAARDRRLAAAAALCRPVRHRRRRPQLSARPSPCCWKTASRRPRRCA
jgi:hypothetical protein